MPNLEDEADVLFDSMVSLTWVFKCLMILMYSWSLVRDKDFGYFFFETEWHSYQLIIFCGKMYLDLLGWSN